jgi:hypothetical protein
MIGLDGEHDETPEHLYRAVGDFGLAVALQRVDLRHLGDAEGREPDAGGDHHDPGSDEQQVGRMLRRRPLWICHGPTSVQPLLVHALLRLVVGRVLELTATWRSPGWTATADEILAKVRLVQTNIKKLVDNNAK